jgi:hypothetical protein
MYYNTFILWQVVYPIGCLTLNGLTERIINEWMVRVRAWTMGWLYLLGAFAKLWKATVSFVMSVCSSVHPSLCVEQLGFHLMNFHEIWYFSILKKTVKKIQVSLKSDKNNGSFTWRPLDFLIIYCSRLLRMRNVSDRSCKGNQNTYFVYNNFFTKIVHFMR